MGVPAPVNVRLHAISAARAAALALCHLADGAAGRSNLASHARRPREVALGNAMSRTALRFLSKRVLEAAVVAVGVLGLAAAVQAGDASGELRYQAKRGPVTVKLHHAYLVTGPDAMGQPIRELVLSEQDLASAIAGCDGLGCVSGKLGSGATVDFDAGPRLNTWFVANDQLIQHSDTATPDTMSLQENSAQRLAGRWSQSNAEGAVGTVQFDAPLTKAFSKH